jgi:CDP-paratose 2-epimerase
MMQTNVTGSTHLFAFALRRTLPVIFMSTSRVYPYDLVNDCRYRELPTRFELERGNDDISHHGVKTSLRIQGPKTLYGATKLACELLLQELATQFDLPVLINRCGVISGPGQLGKIDQGIFAFWLFCHHWQKPLSYIGFGGQGKQVRDVLHCEDLADLIMIQSRRIEEFRGQVFNAGGGRHSSLSLAEATVLCREITGHKSPITQEPRNRPGDIKWYLSHNADAEREFGWQPRRNPEIVLRDTYEWLLEHELELGRLLG